MNDNSNGNSNGNSDIKSSQSVASEMLGLPLIRALSILLFSMLLFSIPPVNAAIYKCLDDDGGITYSGTECAKPENIAEVLRDSGVGPSLKNPDPRDTDQASGSSPAVNLGSGSDPRSDLRSDLHTDPRTDLEPDPESGPGTEVGFESDSATQPATVVGARARAKAKAGAKAGAGAGFNTRSSMDTITEISSISPDTGKSSNVVRSSYPLHGAVSDPLPGTFSDTFSDTFPDTFPGANPGVIPGPQSGPQPQSSKDANQAIIVVLPMPNAVAPGAASQNHLGAR